MRARRPTKEAARKLYLAARAGKIEASATALLAFQGIAEPSPEQVAGAMVFAAGLDDLHVLARGKVRKED